mmetsp:Transcript_21852/g.24395  ORF Transcript_21852/g.24395 Transcript_21852/m.24395 type:complete len:176 (+) Transcript_21852:100-627(+)
MTAKIMVIGDAEVGKTSLLNQYVKHAFKDKYKPTIGADFHNKKVICGDKEIKAQFWDTAGQERFTSLAVAFYGGSDACVIVYNVNELQTFKNILKWKKQFLDTAGGKNLVFCVVGNKAELAGEEQVSVDEAEKFCSANGGMKHFRTCATNTEDVEAVFQHIVQAVVSQRSNMNVE